MSDVLERRELHDAIHLLECDESDCDLMEQMALRMAALLPDCPVQAAFILSLTADIFSVLTESRKQGSAH